MKNSKKTFFVKCLFSGFMLFILMVLSSCESIVRTIFTENERIVSDRLYHVDSKERDIVRVFLGRSFEEYKILGDNTNMEYKKIEFYIALVSLNKISKGEKSLTFNKIGEMGGGDNYIFPEAFNLARGGNEIVGFGIKRNNKNIDLCDYFLGKCLVEIVDRQNFIRLIKERHKTGNVVELDNDRFEFKLLTSGSAKSFISIKVNNKNTYNLSYKLEGSKENFSVHIYSE